MIQEFQIKFVENAKDILMHDSRIEGIALGGSWITQDIDQYSDLDFIIAVNSDYYLDVLQDRYLIAKKLGELLVAFTGEHVGEPRLLICLYNAPLLHVDLKFVDISDMQKRIEDPVVIWDRNGELYELINKSYALFPILKLQWIEDRFWIWIHYAALKYGRGEIFELLDFLSFLRSTVLGPLLLMKNGELPRGVRKIEQHIETNDLKSFSHTVASYNKNQCADALINCIRLYKDLRNTINQNNDLVINEIAEREVLKYLHLLGIRETES